MTHDLHRGSKAANDKFQKVDMLISFTKNIFLKVPARINKFKEMCPTFSLPPRSVITCWGTWLEADFYYGKTFDKTKNVVNIFNENCARSIQQVQDLFKDNLIKKRTYSNAIQFSMYTETIVQIEKSDANLRETIALVQNVEFKISGEDIAIGFAKNLTIANITNKPVEY